VHVAAIKLLYSEGLESVDSVRALPFYQPWRPGALVMPRDNDVTPSATECGATTRNSHRYYNTLRASTSSKMPSHHRYVS
jgi:hypothetical protein